jgi:hypothetical protein
LLTPAVTKLKTPKSLSKKSDDTPARPGSIHPRPCFIIENSRRSAPRPTARNFFARPFQKIGGGGAINYPSRGHDLATTISGVVQVIRPWPSAGRGSKLVVPGSSLRTSRAINSFMTVNRMILAAVQSSEQGQWNAGETVKC